MSKPVQILIAEYTAALKSHLDHSDEGVLERAYELGRTAVGEGLGVLDISAIHHSALRSIVRGEFAASERMRVESAAEFLAESLSPFEMVLRGFKEANAQLKAMNEQLHAAKTAAESLLAAYERAERVATRFQEAALPEALPKVAGFTFDAYYRPGPHASVIGGDWYDALRLADGRVVLSVGDVGGSGLGAVIMMAMIRQVIRGVAYVHPDPIMILDAAGKALRSEHPDAYASAFVGVIDPVAMTLTYASAGHPAPLLRLPDGTIEELAYDGVLLGLRMPDGGTPITIAYRTGSRLVLYTDGLIETDGDLFAGELRLRKAIAESSRGTRDDRASARDHAAHSIYDAILGKGARDDVAILTVDFLQSIFDRSGNGELPRASRWVFNATDADAARRARSEFIEKLGLMGATADDIYAAEVVFSELLGNVLRYTPGPVEILVDWTGPAPVLHFRDQGPGFSHAPQLPRHLMAENGRGLYIVAALTDDFNVTRMDGRGSHARAVVSLSRRQLSATASAPRWLVFDQFDECSSQSAKARRLEPTAN